MYVRIDKHAYIGNEKLFMREHFIIKYRKETYSPLTVVIRKKTTEFHPCTFQTTRTYLVIGMAKYIQVCVHVSQILRTECISYILHEICILFMDSQTSVPLPLTQHNERSQVSTLLDIDCSHMGFSYQNA